MEEDSNNDSFGIKKGIIRIFETCSRCNNKGRIPCPECTGNNWTLLDMLNCRSCDDKSTISCPVCHDNRINIKKELYQCEYCGWEVSPRANSYPKCGEPFK